MKFNIFLDFYLFYKMFFINKNDLEKRFRLLRKEISIKGISEELRGWNYDQPPIEPPIKEIFFGVGDLASRYCPTLRDIYLKRILNIKPPPSLKMVRGIAYHYISHIVLLNVKKFLYENSISKISGAALLDNFLQKSEDFAIEAVKDAENKIAILNENDFNTLKNECYNFYRFILIQAASGIDNAISKFPHADVDTIVNVAIPPIAERKVNGSLIGLSKELSVDIYAPRNAVADLKTGEIRKFHPYTITGYALAIEADEEISIDYGLTIYIKNIENRCLPSLTFKTFIISDELRREFLEIRDEAIEIVEHGRDPGKPSICPNYCPYYTVCNK